MNHSTPLAIATHAPLACRQRYRAESKNKKMQMYDGHSQRGGQDHRGPKPPLRESGLQSRCGFPSRVEAVETVEELPQHQYRECGCARKFQAVWARTQQAIYWLNQPARQEYVQRQQGHYRHPDATFDNSKRHARIDDALAASEVFAS
jgi:hypothetical protein